MQDEGDYEDVGESYLSSVSYTSTMTRSHKGSAVHSETRPTSVSQTDEGCVYLLIGIKLILALFTLIGGAILALCINVWIPQKAVPLGELSILPSDGLDENVVRYCQYENQDSSLCLDDMQHVDTLTKGSLLLNTCHKFSAVSQSRSQYFHPDKKGRITKPKNAKNTDKMCLDIDDLQNVIINDCFPERMEQNWEHQGSAIVSRTTGLCLTGVTGPGFTRVKLDNCSNERNQQWRCLQVDKSYGYMSEKNPKHLTFKLIGM